MVTRPIRILNVAHDPPIEKALIELDDRNVVHIVHATAALRKQMERGVLDWRSKTHTLVPPSAGAKFMDLLISEFKSLINRASEEPV